MMCILFLWGSKRGQAMKELLKKKQVTVSMMLSCYTCYPLS
jgi:hypothetical protein